MLTVDQVLEATDIVAVVQERVALTRKGKDFIGLCPFHNDHKPSMAVSPAKQIFKCWSCGAGGNALRFVQLFEKIEFREALEALARRAGLEVRGSTIDAEAGRRREELRRVLEWARQHFQHNLHAAASGRGALAYAEKRGLTNETIARFGLGFAADAWDDVVRAAERAKVDTQLLEQAGLVARKEETGRVYDRFRNRLIFPISDALGRVVAFGGRALADDPAKYLNSPETALFSKSRILYGFDAAKTAIAATKSVIVVEGYMDAVVLAQAGIENVAATLGTALTDAHVKSIKPYVEKVYLCFDGDDAGVAAADRAVAVAVRTGLEVRVVVCPDGQDPADCVVAGGAELFNKYLHSAKDALHFKWGQTVGAMGRGGALERRAAVEAYLRFIAGLTGSGSIDPIQQGLLIGRLGEVLGLPTDAVYEMLGRVRPVPRSRAAHAATRDDEAELASYATEVRSLPAGLVSAAEELLGCLMRGALHWRSVSDDLARAAALVPTWRKTYERLLGLLEDHGEYDFATAQDALSEPRLLNFVHLASDRVRFDALDDEAFRLAAQRLRNELQLIDTVRLTERLKGIPASDPDGDQAFRAFLKAAPQAGPLAPQYRLRGREF